MNAQFKLLKHAMLVAIVILAFVSCSKDDDSNSLDNTNNPNNPAYASGTISFKLNGEEVNISIPDDGISIPSEITCNGNYPSHCYVSFEGFSESYAVVFNLYKFSEGLFENSEDKNPFVIGIFEAKDGVATGKVEVLTSYDDKNLTCKLNITSFDGFRLIQHEPSYQRANLDKFIATFEMEIHETEHKEKISITEGKIEASFK